MRPIYSTNGEWVALLHEGYLYDTLGEWIAWLDSKEVYSRDGEYVGFLSDDWRILRERIRKQRPFRPAPPAPPKIRPPAKVSLAPLFAELPWNLVDVFEEEPEIFKYVSELRPDWEG
ncbi:MAG: 4-fold beta flower protein [Anaerolineae bacterium]